jgi:predicted nucleotidyltransferase
MSHHKLRSPTRQVQQARRAGVVRSQDKAIATRPTIYNEPMDMQDGWLRGLRSWAAANESVRQLWLFGSRARGEAREDSDVDIALALMPPVNNHDWALGNYFALESEWKEQLQAIVQRDVSIAVLAPGTEADIKVRQSGVLLWARVSR